MLDYNDLNDEEKRTLKSVLGIERMTIYYLEDHNILLMETEELFKYIYMLDLKKVKDAINLIERIVKLEIASGDVNKSIMQKVLEENECVFKLSDKHYAYKES